MHMADPAAAIKPTPQGQPNNSQAEQAVIGGLLLEQNAWDEVIRLVGEDDFYHPRHRLLFQAITSLRQNNQPADYVTLTEWLTRRNKLNEAGGNQYLASIIDSVAGTANIRNYASIVHELSVRRLLMKTGSEISQQAQKADDQTLPELLTTVEQRIFDIGNRQWRVHDSCQPINDVLEQVVRRIQELHKSKNHITGLSTGFTDFDMMTAGLQKSDLVIVAGRPSMGKTAFAVNIALNSAVKDGKKVALFSMEMPAIQLAMRMLASLARIDQKKLRTGQLTDIDFTHITSAINIMEKANLYIDDTSSLTPAELAAACRRLARRHDGLDMIVVDYMQLMHIPDTGRQHTRTTEMSEISRHMKALAKEMDTPVIALSQLNRNVDSRIEHRPVMSDLRESGAIEQDADLIVFIYREDAYSKETDGAQKTGEAEIIIGKQRNGPTGTVHLRFQAQYTCFENLISDEQYGSYTDHTPFADPA